MGSGLCRKQGLDNTVTSRYVCALKPCVTVGGLAQYMGGILHHDAAGVTLTLLYNQARWEELSHNTAPYSDYLLLK